MTFRITNLIFGILFVGLLAVDKSAYPISGYVYLALAIIYSLIIFYGTINLSAEFFGPAKCKGTHAQNSVAITFDDGPEWEGTKRILNILKENRITATFFCIGKHVKNHPDIVKELHEAGHIIGNHSFKHGPWFDLLPRWRMVNEINNTNSVIAETIGKHPKFFRPPFGVINPMLASAIQKTKMTSVGWTIRSFDTTARDKDALLKRVTSNLKSGDIILFHDRCRVTADVLPELLSSIAKAGLKVEPLDKILGEEAYA